MLFDFYHRDLGETHSRVTRRFFAYCEEVVDRLFDTFGLELRHLREMTRIGLDCCVWLNEVSSAQNARLGKERDTCATSESPTTLCILFAYRTFGN